MKFSDLITALENTSSPTPRFALPNGKLIPAHYHVTEMGLQTKRYIDCGNTVREEHTVTFQLWYAEDVEHRLSAEKFLKIIKAAKPLIAHHIDAPIEVEYQTDLTIGKFGLTYQDGVFQLTGKETTCLANDHCGIPAEKMKLSLADLITPATANACAPGSGCC